MLKYLLPVFAIATIAAAPVAAQTNAGFVGPRVELNVGTTDINNSRDLTDVDYGLTLGFDTAVSDRITLGGEATVQNAFHDESRQFGVGARLGYAITPELLGFARVGYTNLDRYNLDGVNFGGGLNYRLTPNTFISAEYRRTEFDRNISSDSALLGVGLRF